MADDATRQKYRLATGKGLEGSPPKTSNPGLKKGGKVKMPKAKGNKTPC
jgi:hypothetical protein